MPVALEYMKGRVFFVSYAGSKEELMKFDEKCECLCLGSNQGPADGAAIAVDTSYHLQVKGLKWIVISVKNEICSNKNMT